jgi:hypothetical protein
MFAHFTKQDINAENLKCLVSFCLALPGCNAAAERVFSLINALWTDEINRLNIETVEALTIVKTYFNNFSCAEFYVQISEEEEEKVLNRSINLINILMNLKYKLDDCVFFKGAIFLIKYVSDL